jgi:Uma2 family endonuclease
MDVIRPIFSSDDLAQMPDDGKRYEILEGDLAVSPAPNRKHQRIVLNCADFLRTLELHHYGEVYTAPFDVVFDRYNVVEPDVLFVCQDRLDIVTDANVQGPPDIVVEVLSPSTRDRDLGVKVHLYARFGVREYWVMDPDDNALTVFSLTDDGFRQHGPYLVGDDWISPLFPDHPLAVAALFR